MPTQYFKDNEKAMGFCNKLRWDGKKDIEKYIVVKWKN